MRKTRRNREWRKNTQRGGEKRKEMSFREKGVDDTGTKGGVGCGEPVQREIRVARRHPFSGARRYVNFLPGLLKKKDWMEISSKMDF